MCELLCMFLVIFGSYIPSDSWKPHPSLYIGLDDCVYSSASSPMGHNSSLSTRSTYGHPVGYVFSTHLIINSTIMRCHSCASAFYGLSRAQPTGMSNTNVWDSPMETPRPPFVSAFPVNHRPCCRSCMSLNLKTDLYLQGTSS